MHLSAHTSEENHHHTHAHHLHIWRIDETEISLECHLVANNTQVIAQAAHLLREKFGISHANIQIEPHDECQPCHL